MSILTEQELINIINNPANNITDVTRNADNKIVEFKTTKRLQEIVGKEDLEREEAYNVFKENRPATCFDAYERVADRMNLQSLLTSEQQELFKDDTGKLVPAYQVTFDSILSMLKREGCAPDILQNALKWRSDAKSFEVALDQWVESLTVLQEFQYEYMGEHSVPVHELLRYELPSEDVFAKAFKEQFRKILYQCIQNPRVRDRVILILTLDANSPKDWKFLLSHNYNNSLEDCCYWPSMNAMQLGGDYVPMTVSHELDHTFHNLLYMVYDCERCMIDFGTIPFTRKLVNLPDVEDKMIQVSRREMEAFWGIEESQTLQFTNSQINFSKRVLCERYFMKAVWSDGEEMFTRMGVNMLSDHDEKIGIFFNPFSEIGVQEAVIWGHPERFRIVENHVYDMPTIVKDVVYMLPGQDNSCPAQFPIVYLNPEVRDAINTIANDIKTNGFPVPAADIQRILFKILKVTTDIRPCPPVNPEGTADDFYSNLSQLHKSFGLKSVEDYREA
ncbi:MAG: hypothetical protein MJ218_00435 [Opitutales bacterium]|nr:hypothetical protein [Opitutales bacterium]